MLLSFTEEHKKHLAFFTKIEPDIFDEFVRISIEFIKNGTNPKFYPSAADKLGVDPETVKKSVEAMMYLLLECAKTMISELDFQDSLLTVGFPQKIVKHLLQVYLEERKSIRNVLTELKMDLPHYHNMEWRLDVQVASRAIKQQSEPSIVLKLTTEEDESKSAHLLQTDPVNLVHMTSVLEEALKESRSQHCRRIMRNIK